MTASLSGSSQTRTGRWPGLGREEAVAASSEPWFQARIYRKLNDKLSALER